ncbi:helix-turn-helix domain-containing protein [Wansuia hejianensis]|uniref:Helix-turn-helix transcriptional regulator n=1 Tax=Wansuia hejianensis TaxID=2763667 RepID=A0A926EWX5_9FIRM|nr:helix-turn-helix transcriptional regulator [Wansuia hejianensis]MBC8591378.1 helix-turn-helix transcriptional regulator [Wansuia hejianensis]
MSNRFNVGKKIREIREERGLSQLSVVNKLEEQDISMSRETLSKIETNNRSISAIELNGLSKVLNVDISDFFHEKGTEDIVTFFRKRNFSQNTIDEVSKLQEIIKVFINHEKIYKEDKNL